MRNAATFGGEVVALFSDDAACALPPNDEPPLLLLQMTGAGATGELVGFSLSLELLNLGLLLCKSPA